MIEKTLFGEVLPRKSLIDRDRMKKREKAFNVPTILTREATTEMLVRDGSTVVIGGLYQRTVQSARTGIPWLSNVPGMRWLFRNNRNNDTHEELLIFITPRIIKQPDVPSKAHASAMN